MALLQHNAVSRLRKACRACGKAESCRRAGQVHWRRLRYAHVPPRSLYLATEAGLVPPACSLVSYWPLARPTRARGSPRSPPPPGRYPLKLTHRRTDSSPIHPLFMPSQKQEEASADVCSDHVRYRRACDTRHRAAHDLRTKENNKHAYDPPTSTQQHHIPSSSRTYLIAESRAAASRQTSCAEPSPPQPMPLPPQHNSANFSSPKTACNVGALN